VRHLLGLQAQQLSLAETHAADETSAARVSVTKMHDNYCFPTVKLSYSFGEDFQPAVLKYISLLNISECINWLTSFESRSRRYSVSLTV
jgi:hypothetical protein